MLSKSKRVDISFSEGFKPLWPNKTLKKGMVVLVFPTYISTAAVALTYVLIYN